MKLFQTGSILNNYKLERLFVQQWSNIYIKFCCDEIFHILNMFKSIMYAVCSKV